MSITESVKVLNRSIEEHYDIIWQEDWYDFYDVGMDLVRTCRQMEMSPGVRDAAQGLAFQLERGGDAPNQETWFDICSAVFALTMALYEDDRVPETILEEFFLFYETA